MNPSTFDVSGARWNKKVLYSIGLLLLLSTAGLLWNQFGMERLYSLDASSALPVRAIDDSSYGGKTSSTIRRVGGRFVVDGDIRAGYAWPHCNMVFELGRPSAEVDLSLTKLCLYRDYERPRADAAARPVCARLQPGVLQTGCA